MTEPGHLPLPDAALRLHSTELNVLMHLKRGLLRGREVEGTWWIEQASLDKLLAQTGGGKSETVCASHCGKKACGSCQ